MPAFDFLNFMVVWFNVSKHYVKIVNARIAQLVEHSTDTRAVPSSNLGSRTENKKIL